MADIKKRKPATVMKKTKTGGSQASVDGKKQFSVDVMSILHVLDISNDVLRTITSEADRLLNNTGAIERKPTLDARNPSNKYHVATGDKKRGFVVCTVYSDHVNCECNSFKCQGLCKHSICVAETCNILKKHLERIVKNRRKLRTPQQPPKETAGKKGGHHRNQWRPRSNLPAGSGVCQVPIQPFTEVHHNNHKMVVHFTKDEPNAIECRQCGNEFPRRIVLSPFDIVLSHKERWIYWKQDENANKRSAKFTTKYYCVNASCILGRFHYFTAAEFLEVPDSVKKRLHLSHIEALKEQLGYTG